jgi:putative membrane protein
MMMMGFGFLLMILFWIGLIVAAVWLVRMIFSPPGQPWERPVGPEMSAREILDRRYARGEIDREQYDMMKEAMSREIG